MTRKTFITVAIVGLVLAAIIGWLLYKGAFRSEISTNTEPLKLYQMGRLTIEAPEFKRVDSWAYYLKLEDSSVGLYEFLYEKEGVTEDDFEEAWRNEQKNYQGFSCRPVDAQGRFERPARFDICRQDTGRLVGKNREVVKYIMLLHFPDGYMRIVGPGLMLDHDETGPGEEARLIAERQASFLAWIRNFLYSYRWVGAQAQPDGTGFRTLFGKLEGELAKADWDVSTFYKNDDSIYASFGVSMEMEGPFPFMFKEEEFLDHYLLDRLIRGSGYANSYEAMTVNGDPGHESIDAYYYEGERAYLAVGWRADDYQTKTGRPRIWVTLSNNWQKNMDEKNIPAFLGAWRAVLASINWPAPDDSPAPQTIEVE